MINDENIKDVEFEDVSQQEKTIRGSVLYYSTSQVAQILGIPDSTVRYYTKVFDDILHIEISNKQRRYKNSDIEEYCSEVSFQEGNGVQIKESNPLSIQALTKAIMDHQEKQIKAMEERIMDRINESILNQSMITSKTMEDIKEEICTTVDEVVSERLEMTNNSIYEINNKIDEIKEFACVDMNKEKERENDKWWKKIFR